MVKRENGSVEGAMVEQDEEATTLLSDLDALDGAEVEVESNRMMMRRLRDVVKFGLGWDTSAVTPQPFTDQYEFSVKTPTGNVYKVSSVKTFANMISAQSWIEDCERDPSLREDADARSAFYERFGHFPSPKQFDHYRRTGEYIPAK